MTTQRKFKAGQHVRLIASPVSYDGIAIRRTCCITRAIGEVFKVANEPYHASGSLRYIARNGEVAWSPETNFELNPFQIGDKVEYNGNLGYEYEVAGIRLDGNIDLRAKTGSVFRDYDWRGCRLLSRPGETPVFQPLDDAGRANLKVGDEVLVRATIYDVGRARTIIAMNDGDGKTNLWAHPADVFAILPKAPVPVAVGDRVEHVNSMTSRANEYRVVYTTDDQLVLRSVIGGQEKVTAVPRAEWKRFGE